MPKRVRTRHGRPSNPHNVVGTKRTLDSTFPQETHHQTSSSKAKTSTPRRNSPLTSPNSDLSGAKRSLIEEIRKIKVPKAYGPDFNWEENASILVESWSYSQKFAALSPEILKLKPRYPDMAKLSQEIQSVANKMMMCFGMHMPQHRWFTEYGDRIFPELVSWHLKGIDGQVMLELYTSHLTKWTWVIDYVRHLERARAHKLILASTPMVGILDAMIRSNWDGARIQSLLKLSFTFARWTLADREVMKTLEALRWLVKGILFCASDKVSAKMRGMLSHDIQNFWPETNDSHGIDVLSESSKFGFYLNHFFQSTLLHPGSLKLNNLENNFHDLLKHLSNVSSSIPLAQTTFIKCIRNQYFSRSLGVPQSISAVPTFKPLKRTPGYLKNVFKRLISENHAYKTMDHDHFVLESSSLLPVSRPWMGLNPTPTMLSADARTFIDLLMANKDDKMSRYSCEKLYAVLQLATEKLSDVGGQEVLIHEMLPLLFLGNHSKPPTAVAVDWKMEFSPLEEIVQYVYEHTDQKEQRARLGKVRCQLTKLKTSIQTEASALSALDVVHGGQ